MKPGMFHSWGGFVSFLATVLMGAVIMAAGYFVYLMLFTAG